MPPWRALFAVPVALVAVVALGAPACQGGSTGVSSIVDDPGDGIACGAGDFLDVTASSVPSGQPTPSLSARCEGDWLVVDTNGVPTFDFVPMTPNALREQSYTWRIPRQPVVASSPEQIPLLGPVAIAVDGMPIYGPNEAPMHGTADPYTDGLLDTCGGHTGPQGEYHYHVRATCIVADESPYEVVGYAFDGYPILGPVVCVDEGCTQTRRLQSSWQKVSDARNAWDSHAFQEGSGDLDACNGTTLADGSYAYIATDGFPYLMACYHGVVPSGAGG